MRHETWMERDERSAEQIRSDQLKLHSAADLIERIESTGYTAEPGPLINRLEWMEIKRRLSQLDAREGR